MSGSNLLTALLERTPTALLLLNREGQVVTANGEACRLLAVESERLTGKPVLGTVVPGDRERVKQLFLRVLEGTEREWIARFQRGDGATRVQWVRAVPVGGGDGPRIAMFARDITEHRSGRPETLQLQSLFENLPGQMVAVLDLSGRIRYSSGMSRTHFRDDLEEVGKPYQELLEPDGDSLTLLTRMLGELAEGREWAGTHRHRRRDGTVFPMRTFASPYLDPRTGKVLGGLLVGRDAAIEEELRARCEEGERMAEIGIAVSEVAARFREGLDRMDAALGRGVPSVGLPEPYSVPREVEGLRALASAVEEMARLAQPRRELVFLARELPSLLEALGGAFAAAGLEVRLTTPPELAPVHVDPHQTRHALRVLLGFAAGHARAPGAREVTIALTALPEGVRLRLGPLAAPRDPRDLDRYFDPFVHDVPGPEGLALSWVRAVVRAHGGSVEVGLRGEGGGVDVTLTVPYEAPDATLRFRSSPLSLSETRSVLVVDDEAHVRTAIRRFLEKVGFDVREAWSGRSALAQITAGSPPELVLTDLKMSEGSGSWFLEQLAHDFPDLLRRTVILTGDTDPGALSGLVRRSGCPVLQKPVELPQLLEILDEVSGR